MSVVTPFGASYNSLTFGGTGSQIQLLGYDNGLRSIPNLRTGDVPNARRDGASAGLDLLGERIFTVTLQPFIQSTTPFETLLEQISTAFQSISSPTGQLPYEFFLPGWANSRFITCRPTNGGVPIDLTYQAFASEVPIQMTANDPLIYSTVLKTASAGLPSPTAGLTFNATPNFVFGASTGGSFSTTNNGNYITPIVFTITGPVTNPAVTFTATGQFLKFNITLGSTDTLVVDTGARTVQLDGSSYRFNTVATGSTWFGIPPSTVANPTWSIGVSSSDSSAVAAVFSAAWHDAWGWA